MKSFRVHTLDQDQNAMLQQKGADYRLGADVLSHFRMKIRSIMQFIDYNHGVLIAIIFDMKS